jgi:hypothetical protein
MCLTQQPRPIPAPVVAPAPTRAQIAARATNGLVADNRNIVAKRQGVFGNIRTTPMGDASYGTSAVARFG